MRLTPIVPTPPSGIKPTITGAKPRLRRYSPCEASDPTLNATTDLESKDEDEKELTHSTCEIKVQNGGLTHVRIRFHDM